MNSFKIFSKNFLGICISGFFYFSSFFILIPILPIYVDNLGGTSSEIGLVTGIFAISAVALRPYFGKLADIYGLRKFLLIGALLFALPYIAYSLVDSINILYPIRILHGIAHGIYMAAAFVYVADLAPEDRRGEIIGIYSTMNVLAMALAPALGSFIMSITNSFTVIFSTGLAMAIVSFMAAYTVDEKKLGKKASGSISILTVFLKKPVLVGSFTLGTAAAAYGSITTFLPVYAPLKGIYNVGLFFTFYAVFTILSRVVAGKLSDRHGRYKVVLPCMILLIVAMGLLATMDSMIIMFIAAALFGMGFGSILPTLNAYIVDEVNEEERSSSLAVFSSFQDIGVCLGAVLFGFIGEFSGYSNMYTSTCGFVFLGFMVFVLGARKSRKQQEKFLG